MRILKNVVLNISPIPSPVDNNTYWVRFFGSANRVICVGSLGECIEFIRAFFVCKAEKQPFILSTYEFIADGCGNGTFKIVSREQVKLM